MPDHVTETSVAPAPLNAKPCDLVPGGWRTPGSCVRSAACALPAGAVVVVVVGGTVVEVAGGAVVSVAGVEGTCTTASVCRADCDDAATVVVVVPVVGAGEGLCVVAPSVGACPWFPVRGSPAAAVIGRPPRADGRGVLPVATSNAMSASDTARITHQFGRARRVRRIFSVASGPPPTTGTPYARATPPAPVNFRRRVAGGPGLSGRRGRGGCAR